MREKIQLAFAKQNFWIWVQCFNHVIFLAVKTIKMCKSNWEVLRMNEPTLKKAVEIAKNMLAMGIEVSVTAKASGLSEAEVESLRKIQ